MTKPDMSFKLIGHNEPINSVAFSSNQTQIVSSSNDMNLYLWNLKKNKKPHKLSGHKSAITEVSPFPTPPPLKPYKVAFAPSGNYMATGSLDNTVRIWANSQVDQYPSNALRSHTACVRTVAFSPDSRFLISGSDDKTVKLFNVKLFLKIKK
jgi:WD40 repeat protein